MQWFNVDKDGLAKLVEGMAKVFVLNELYQNGGLDTDATRLDIVFESTPGKRGRCLLTVDDDHPEGFKNLADAWTLFAESEKKDNPEKAGRFNLGEKLVLSLCESAIISSTTGTVYFNEEGRKKTKEKRAAGSRFDAVIKCTKTECEQACRDFLATIPRDGLTVILNGEELEHRDPVTEFEAALPTVHGEFLRPTTRKTNVRVYEPGPDEEPMIYELGIPVVETGDKYHVSIGQKVPLNSDRDNVTPGYLRKVRTLVANETFENLSEEEAQETWVIEAVKDENIDEKAYGKLQELRHGKDAVRHDPSHPEATKRAVAAGLPVIYGRSMSEGERDNAKRFETFQTAHEVTPEPTPYSESGRPMKLVPEDKVTDAMHTVAKFAHNIGLYVLDRRVQVKFANDSKWPFAATYGRGELTLNVGRLGYKWFNKGVTATVIDLIIHEFAHEYSSDHLSDSFHEACCKVGAKVAMLALDKPQIFTAKYDPLFK